MLNCPFWILNHNSSDFYFRIKCRLHEFFNLDKDLCEEDYKTVSWRFSPYPRAFYSASKLQISHCQPFSSTRYKINVMYHSSLLCYVMLCCVVLCCVVLCCVVLCCVVLCRVFYSPIFTEPEVNNCFIILHRY